MHPVDPPTRLETRIRALALRLIEARCPIDRARLAREREELRDRLDDALHGAARG